MLPLHCFHRVGRCNIPPFASKSAPKLAQYKTGHRRLAARADQQTVKRDDAEAQQLHMLGCCQLVRLGCRDQNLPVNMSMKALSPVAKRAMAKRAAKSWLTGSSSAALTAGTALPASASRMCPNMPSAAVQMRTWESPTWKPTRTAAQARVVVCVCSMSCSCGLSRSMPPNTMWGLASHPSSIGSGPDSPGAWYRWAKQPVYGRNSSTEGAAAPYGLARLHAPRQGCTWAWASKALVRGGRTAVRVAAVGAFLRSVATATGEGVSGTVI